MSTSIALDHAEMLLLTRLVEAHERLAEQAEEQSKLLKQMQSSLHFLEENTRTQ